MASVVDTSVKHFRGDMSGAPGLSGTVGALIALLDACLVSGFDVKTASSLVVSGGVATLAFTGGHSATVDSVILVSGSSIAALNGEQKVIATPGGQIKFATSAPDGAASGTITFKMAPAGWEKVYSKTNVAAYRSLDPASSKMLLRVDDTNAQFARVVGYESMSDVDTGAGPFPTAVQISGGGYWAKSNAASTALNTWALFADSRFFLFNAAISSYAVAGSVHGATRGFGDLLPKRPSGDPYACVLNYSGTSSVPSMYDSQFEHGADQRHAMPRGYSGLGSAVLHYCMPYTGSTAGYSGSDPFLGSFPCPVSGELKFTRRYFNTVQSGSTGAVRAELPGLYAVPQAAVADTFKLFAIQPGTGSLAGRNLMAINTTITSLSSAVTSSGNAGCAFVDITGPWR